ncbi:MAG: AbrB/MazE/SpoVT family DNA-binding domain-containing protein [Clostridia bacterium]|nr:AbrB/MazE/SpoVT family DNA-binding domain-containing protein [Clostridia bacterium]
MKTTGIVRSIDELGRLVIPKELRKSLGMPAGTPVEILAIDGKIVVQKFCPGCHLCGGTEDLKELHGTSICAVCRSEIASL